MKNSTKDSIFIGVAGIATLSAIGGIIYGFKGLYDMSVKQSIRKKEEKEVAEGTAIKGKLSDEPKQEAKIKKDLKIATILFSVFAISTIILKKYK